MFPWPVPLPIHRPVRAINLKVKQVCSRSGTPVQILAVWYSERWMWFKSLSRFNRVWRVIKMSRLVDKGHDGGNNLWAVADASTEGQIIERAWIAVWNHVRACVCLFVFLISVTALINDVLVLTCKPHEISLINSDLFSRGAAPCRLLPAWRVPPSALRWTLAAGWQPCTCWPAFWPSRGCSPQPCPLSRGRVAASPAPMVSTRLGGGGYVYQGRGMGCWR